MIFARKMPEFYVIIAQKYFFLNFRGHVLLRLWCENKQTYKHPKTSTRQQQMSTQPSRVGKPSTSLLAALNAGLVLAALKDKT